MIQTYFRNVLVAQGNSGQQINIKYKVTKAWNNTQSDNPARLTRPADGLPPIEGGAPPDSSWGGPT